MKKTATTKPTADTLTTMTFGELWSAIGQTPEAAELRLLDAAEILSDTLEHEPEAEDASEYAERYRWGMLKCLETFLLIEHMFKVHRFDLVLRDMRKARKVAA